MNENLPNILQEKLHNLPADPGVYQFINDKGKVIYVGKAKNLRNRVRTYFHSSVDSPKTLALVKKVHDLQLIATSSEVEALMLENTLIKELKPRYNINLKDDKTFPYIRVTNEPYPQIFPTRNVVKDGSKYFGPYTNVSAMRSTLKMINRTFKIRSCKYMIDDESIAKGKVRVCLDFHIKKCEGPCEGLVSQSDYNDMVHEVIKLLKGRTKELIAELETKMGEASINLQYEKAAELRDKIQHLRSYSDKQAVVSTDFGDRDIFAAAVEDKDVAATILNIRDGKLVGKKELNLQAAEGADEPAAVYYSLLKFYYDNEYVEIPKEIILEIEPKDAGALTDWLEQKGERRPKFLYPQRKSEAKGLLDMCKRNAELKLKEIQLHKMKKEGEIPYVLQSLKRDLHLREMPRRIECFDISHIQGTDTVASMVVFVDGKPKKSEYRKFIIRTTEEGEPDDFQSMREVVERRYKRLVEEDQPLPDLIMVDGGKGQLSSALEILADLGIRGHDIIGLAKRLEEVFLPNTPEAQTIPKTSSSLKLLQHLRDEAHRFAVTFHRERRSKRTITSELLEVKGIGPKIAEKLLSEFKSVPAIKAATKEELAKVVGGAKADIIRNWVEEQGQETK